ncbi:TPA: hypothetical protein I8298_004389 [Citrobacter freundii]|nr:hypothetical protein [Citrobacter freundii]
MTNNQLTDQRECNGCGNEEPEYIKECPHCGAEKIADDVQELIKRLPDADQGGA